MPLWGAFVWIGVIFTALAIVGWGATESSMTVNDRYWGIFGIVTLFIAAGSFIAAVFLGVR